MKAAYQTYSDLILTKGHTRKEIIGIRQEGALKGIIQHFVKYTFGAYNDLTMTQQRRNSSM